MNDNEKQLFKKAIALNDDVPEGAPQLPADFAAKVMERIARERAQNELRADRMSMIAAAAVSVAGFAAMAAAIIHLGWFDVRALWESIAGAFDIRDELNRSHISALLIPASALLLDGLMFLWIDTRRKRKAR